MNIFIGIITASILFMGLVYSEEADLSGEEVVEPYFDSTRVTGFNYDKLSDSIEVIDSTDAIPIQDDHQTCSELYKELKKSDCGQTIFKYIKGASIKIGITFNTSSLELQSDDTLFARLVGILTPAPYYAISLHPRYFGGSHFGYQVAVVYSSSSTVEQMIERGDKKKYYDLHTLSIINLAAVTPSIFFDILGTKKRLDTFLRIGLGLGVGWSSVRGVAYLTEKDEGVPGSCYDVSTQVFDGNQGKDAIEISCKLENFNNSSLGGSIRLFLDGRKKWFYGAFEAAGMAVRNSKFDLVPFMVKIKLAYMLDI